MAELASHPAIVSRIAERARVAGSRDESLIVGLCGAQGSGKTTLTAALKRSLEERGFVVAALSLDDLYLPLGERELLARTVHPLLRTRGVPGTHDVDLGMRTFAALRKRGTVLLPAFDKALDDQLPQGAWPHVQAPVDVVLFEGWCVGAVAEPEAALSRPVNALEREEDPECVWRRYVNRALAERYQDLYRQIDLLILLAAPAFDVVYQWRREQESELRKKVAAQGGDPSKLMSDEQLRRFISHYERLTRHILAEMPSRADVLVRLDTERRAVVE